VPKYILDTNPIRYFTNRKFTTAKELEVLLERGSTGDLRLAYTPTANIELASQIEELPGQFEDIREAVRHLVDMNAEVLPDFEHRMTEIAIDGQIPSSMYAFWGEMMTCIQKAPDAKALRDGFDDLTTKTHRAVYTDFLADFRAQYEADYLASWSRVLNTIIPNFEDRVSAGKHTRLSKDEQAALETFLSSSEWDDTLLAIVAHRGKRLLPTADFEVATVRAKVKYFREGFEWLIRKSAADGLRPNTPKRKNDYNDIHLLLYINDYTADVLVSEDKEFTKKVSCLGTKVITYRDFIQREAHPV